MSNQSAELQETDWSDLRHVLAVARTGRLSAAAQRLGVNETTVARRVARAERALGARLFQRLDGQLQPTDAGQVAVAYAERVELEVEGLRRAVAGQDLAAAGTVRLTSVPIVVNRLLAPALPGLVETHPALRLELIAEPRDLSLTKRDADLALRVARPSKEQRVLARRVGRLDYAVYGHAGSPEDGLPWLTYEDRMAALPQAAWIAERLRRHGDATAIAAANDAETLLQLVEAGVGKTLLPSVVGDRLSELERLSGSAPVLTRELWLLVHPELRQLPRIKAVIAWLEGLLKDLGVS